MEREVRIALEFWNDLGAYLRPQTAALFPFVSRTPDSVVRLTEAYAAILNDRATDRIADGAPVTLLLHQIVLLNRSLGRIEATVDNEQNPFNDLARAVFPDIQAFSRQVRAEGPHVYQSLAVVAEPEYEALMSSRSRFPLLAGEYEGWLAGLHPGLVGLPDEWVAEVLRGEKS